ncbi:hypothetical protein, partial, partial [Absidia glauca]
MSWLAIQTPNPPRPITYPAPYHVVGACLFDQFSIDFIGPFPTTESGNKYIIIAVENFTRWPVAIATKENDSLTTARFLYEHIFCNFGPPTHLLSDNGIHFLNNVVTQFLELIQVNHKVTSIYHPQTNGMAERINGVVVGSLKKLVLDNKKQWDQLLPVALYAYRIKIHTHLKISPYEALFGQAPGVPISDPLFNVGKVIGYERLVKLWGLRATMESDNDKLKNKLLTHKQFDSLKIGDRVIMKDHKRSGKNKMDPVFLPTIYRIIKAFKNSFQLIDEQGKVFKYRVNAASLKKYRKR